MNSIIHQHSSWFIISLVVIHHRTYPSSSSIIHTKHEYNLTQDYDSSQEMSNICRTTKDTNKTMKAPFCLRNVPDPSLGGTLVIIYMDTTFVNFWLMHQCPWLSMIFNPFSPSKFTNKSKSMCWIYWPILTPILSYHPFLEFPAPRPTNRINRNV